VRELRNALERAAVMASGDGITSEDFRLDAGASPATTPSAATAGLAALPFVDAKRQAVESFERAYLLRALHEHGGNVSRTAAAVGMVRQSLQQKIRELGLRHDDGSLAEE